MVFYHATIPICCSVEATRATASAFRSIVQKRKSCQRFQPNRSIEPTILQDILKSMIRSPSSFNLQPTQVIVVQDPQIKEEIAQSGMIGKGNQYRTRDCSVLAVFCSDLQSSLRIPRIHELERNHTELPRHPDYLAMMPISTSFMLGEGHAATLIKQVTMDLLSTHRQQPMPEIETAQVWAYKNTSLMVQSYVYAATSYNLQTSIMEGYDPRRMKDILHIPSERYGIPMVVATGYEYEHATSSTDGDDNNETDSPQTARLNVNEVVFQETFGVPIQFDDNAETGK